MHDSKHHARFSMGGLMVYLASTDANKTKKIKDMQWDAAKQERVHVSYEDASVWHCTRQQWGRRRVRTALPASSWQM
jgi:hypothetical protein